MPLDDEDDPSLSLFTSSSSSSSATPKSAAAAAVTNDAAPDDQDLVEEEDDSPASQDFRLFKKNAHISAQTIRKGEKDFEAHGTLLQSSALEASRSAMRDVLSYTRVHATSGGAVRGWVFPDWWADYEEVQEEEGGGGKPWGHTRERVVILEGSNVGTQHLGRAVTGLSKGTPGRGRDWLLPEEALYLVERGSMEIWMPREQVGLGDLFPATTAAATAAPAGEGQGIKEQQQEEKEGEEKQDEYAKGFPLSLQAAYAFLIGEDGERGKVSLRKFQVYSNLKRCGYNVLRAPPVSRQERAGQKPEKPEKSLWEWLTGVLAAPATGWGEKKHKPFGPLVQPGLWRSYASIYRQMTLVPLHKPSPVSRAEKTTTKEPFEIHFHVWKSAQKWTKLRQPPPDFYLSVVDAQESSVPQLEDISALLDATPYAPGKPEWTGPGRIYARLKHGHRNVLIAVVDHGVINYMRFAEAAFGEEKVYTRFDHVKKGGNRGPKGGKGGGGGGGKRGGKAGGRGGKKGRTGRG